MSVPPELSRLTCVYLRESGAKGDVMTSSDTTRRRLLLALGSGTTLLAGCGDTDSPAPEPAPPPETATPEPATTGPEPAPETPPGTEEIQQGTGTPVPDDVVFSKPGGGEVPATVYGSGDCGVVLVPQDDMGRQSWDRYARRLAASDYRAIAIDEGEQRRAAGVTAAVRYLRDELDVETVVVVGASVGGGAAVRASAENPDVVDGLVAISPADGADRAGDLTMPALVVVSESDDEQFVTTAETLADGAGEAELVTYEGEAHGQHLLDSPHADDLRSRIGEFVATVCDPEA